jgi:hypothetical protein
MRLIIIIFLAYSVSSSASDNIKDFTVEMGCKQGAIHFGASHLEGDESVKLGEYFFFQTENRDNNLVRVNQLLSAGGLTKF